MMIDTISKKPKRTDLIVKSNVNDDGLCYVDL
jgi:hypothetical protein